MNLAARLKVFAFCAGAFVWGMPVNLQAKSSKATGVAGNSNPAAKVADDAGTDVEFAWSTEKKLSWSDFRGPSEQVDEHSAAATHCGINIASQIGKDKKRHLIVTNTFYATKSWVKPDGRIPSVLVHEQGHFDLCEVFTRKLRLRLQHVNVNSPAAMETVTSIYSAIISEYETQQQAYEEETVHGTDLNGQQSWIAYIERELK